uniref:Helitron helicase-like domain-containing protein n=1 Tax=Meloidogyne enterolobii TaxID=390850 RepID=A0A6V7X8A6_MELEN|nr:unnamed protein product [Meloidogyne enterolobii]
MNKRGRPRKVVRSGRPRKDFNPVPQAAFDFEMNAQEELNREINVEECITESVVSYNSTSTLRRSSRISQCSSRLNDVQESWPVFSPITQRCDRTHFGLGCGAKGANHMPIYYDSLPKDDVRCKYCKANLLPSEAVGNTAFSKCCAKGRVSMPEKYSSLQDIPIELFVIFNDPTRFEQRDNILKHSMLYNDQLAFGHIQIQRQRDFAESHKIVKCNNMINYLLWDFNPPGGGEQPLLRGQLFTIPANEAANRLNEIANDVELDQQLLIVLHNILRDYHPFSTLYRIASETYSNLIEEEQINFRMLVIDTNKIGVERIRQDDEIQPIDIDPQDVQALRRIHPGRLEVQTAAGSRQIAQIYLDTGANVPDSLHYDVILKGRQGTGQVKMSWWDRNIDPTLFPLLFSKGQCGFENGINLNLRPGEELNRANQLVDNEGEEVEVSEELGEGEEFLDPVFEARQHSRDMVSRSQYIRYMFHQRGSWRDSHWLWNWGQLAQLYVIAYNNRVEAQKVQYIKTLQGRTRFVRPGALLNWLEKLRDQQGLKGPIGQIYMTNEHFRGSIQFYQKQYGNCMTICREIGSVDLLITFTMNPEAEELRRMIPDGYSWADRPMEVCRLFIDKLHELQCDLTQREVMGPVKGWFWSLEHQKRYLINIKSQIFFSGLPHVHFAVILDWDRMRTQGCIFTKEDYMDQYICAEIPDLPNESDQSQSAQLQRELYRVIVSANIHKCDKRCLRDGRCKQRFPVCCS